MLHRIARSSLSCRQLYSRPTLLVVKPSYLIQPYLRRSYVTEADHRADGVPSDVAGTAPKVSSIYVHHHDAYALGCPKRLLLPGQYLSYQDIVLGYSISNHTLGANLVA